MGKTEEELIAGIASLFEKATVPVGIGDDAAVIDGAGRTVLTTDMLVEGVDFLSDTRFDLLAVKSLAANLSDVAAMGATPEYILLSVGAPRERIEALQPFFEALAAEARRWHVQLIGGDLSAASEIVISIVAIGRAGIDGRVLTRSGAKRGDRIYLSRPVGGAGAGLSLLQRGWRLDPTLRALAPEGRKFGYAETELAGAVLRQHLAPTAEVEMGSRLAELIEVHACIDLSDGLSTDLGRMCAASQLGAEIEWERIPLFPDLAAAGRRLGIDVEKAVLHGGEEYALLFASSMRESELSRIFGRPVYSIGLMKEESGMTLVRGGAAVPFRPAGYDHFS
jgi:thiamine-monophosphate kinase